MTAQWQAAGSPQWPSAEGTRPTRIPEQPQSLSQPPISWERHGGFHPPPSLCPLLSQSMGISQVSLGRWQPHTEQGKGVFQSLGPLAFSLSLKSEGFGELSNRIHPLAQEEALVPAAGGKPLRLVSPTCVCPPPLSMLSTSPCLSSSSQTNGTATTRLSVAPCTQSMCAPH